MWPFGFRREYMWFWCECASSSLFGGLVGCTFFFFSSRRRHTRFDCDWSSDVCSSDLTHNIVAVKEASGDFAQIMAILRDRPPGFRVLSGDDAVTVPLIALGADGIKIGRASCRERV